MSPDAEDASPSPEPELDQDGSSTMCEIKHDRASTDEKSPSQASNNHEVRPPSKSNAKDPSRPRRKKARRACFACQRAHLTCGDERPCNRCIKRGLQDQCHDGVRKKAKYLHDAPAEALMPGFAGNFPMNGSQNLHGISGQAGMNTSGLQSSQSNSYFPQNASNNHPQYSSVEQGQMTSVGGDFSQATIDPSTQLQASPGQQISPAQQFHNATNLGSTLTPSFDPTYFDSNDPTLANFNMSDFNFGNHYGALEFGMLGHMSSGAAGTPEIDALGSMGRSNTNVSYDGTPGFQNLGYHNFSPWQNVPNGSESRHGSSMNVWGMQNNGMDAFAVGEHSSMTGTSPHSQNQDFPGYSNNTSPDTQFVQLEQNQHSDLFRQSVSQAQQQNQRQSAFPHPAGLKKRRRDTSEIYNSVNAPYKYTQGFHNLTELLHKRFPWRTVQRIAKALGSIRPSFISCNQNLNHDDLVFMEKAFQRTLFEYEEFVNHYGTPTIICRRTGEIAAASKEFSLITGWKRDVLLGKEPNLNVNTGATDGTQTGSTSRGGTITPYPPNADIDLSRPQPVSLAELLDEDSVVQFYEDFAELAFGASRTAVIGSPCSLLKYKTKNDAGWSPEDRCADESQRAKKNAPGELIKGEAGMNTLGEKDGKVDCMMCWTVKRDTFDMPMLIVMNFLPCMPGI